MRWFNFVTLLIYLSVLMASPVKAVVASKVDVPHSGAFSQKALVAFSHELTLTDKCQSSDDNPLVHTQFVTPSTVAIPVLEFAHAQPPSTITAVNQARAPPLS